MPGLHLLHACLPLAGSHSFWETAVYFSHPSPPCALELHGLPGKQCAATGEQNFFLLSFKCHGHPAAALLVPPQTHCEELVALHKLQSARVVLQGSEVALPAAGSRRGILALLLFAVLCPLVLSGAPKAAWGCCPFCTLFAEGWIWCLSLSARTCSKTAGAFQAGWSEGKNVMLEENCKSRGCLFPLVAVGADLLVWVSGM